MIGDFPSSRFILTARMEIFKNFSCSHEKIPEAIKCFKELYYPYFLYKKKLPSYQDVNFVCGSRTRGTSHGFFKCFEKTIKNNRISQPSA